MGPSPAEVIPPIGTVEFLQASVDAVTSFIAPDGSKGTDGWRAYRTLTLCRLLRSLELGALCSKIDGAAWAIERYPERAGLIRAALEVRARGGRDTFTQPQREAIPELLEFLAAEVTRAPL